jgi:hypothetical protein
MLHCPDRSDHLRDEEQGAKVGAAMDEVQSTPVHVSHEGVHNAASLAPVSTQTAGRSAFVGRTAAALRPSVRGEHSQISSHIAHFADCQYEVAFLW